jgi:hypothetical protein
MSASTPLTYGQGRVLAARALAKAWWLNGDADDARRMLTDLADLLEEAQRGLDKASADLARIATIAAGKSEGT